MEIDVTKLPRIFVPKSAMFRSFFKVYEEDTIKKVRNVLRLKHGDNIRIFDGEGGEYLVEMDLLKTDVVGGKVLAPIVEQGSGKEIMDGEFEVSDIEAGEELDTSNNSAANTLKPQIVLLQALTQAKKLDLVIRMATEVGVDKFAFYESDHSLVKIKDLKNIEQKLERWDKITTEAARQSERNIVPEVLEPTSLKKIFGGLPNTLFFVTEKGLDNPVELENFLEQQKNENLEEIYLLVGPEGGFSARELEEIKTKSYTHLDFPVLRTETAGVVAPAVVKYLLG